MSHINDLMNRTLNGEGNSDQHVMAIFSIVLQIKAQNILELGVYEGNTSVPLAFGASKSYYDLVYIDDWHEYSHVKRELELIDKLIDNKSIILLHDLMAFTYPVYHQPLEANKDTEWGEGGPTRAVFELNKDHWEWSTIPVNNGLTILRRI